MSESQQGAEICDVISAKRYFTSRHQRGEVVICQCINISPTIDQTAY